MTDIEEIAEGLSVTARLGLLEGCVCGTGQEMLDLGFWVPEFPPDKHPNLKQEYFKTTPLGEAVKAHLLKDKTHDRA